MWSLKRVQPVGAYLRLATDGNAARMQGPAERRSYSDLAPTKVHRARACLGHARHSIPRRWPQGHR
jgi:hypothetical protein